MWKCGNSFYEFHHSPIFNSFNIFCFFKIQFIFQIPDTLLFHFHISSLPNFHILTSPHFHITPSIPLLPNHNRPHHCTQKQHTTYFKWYYIFSEEGFTEVFNKADITILGLSDHLVLVGCF